MNRSRRTVTRQGWFKADGSGYWFRVSLRVCLRDDDDEEEEEEEEEVDEEVDEDETPTPTL